MRREPNLDGRPSKRRATKAIRRRGVLVWAAVALMAGGGCATAPQKNTPPPSDPFAEALRQGAPKGYTPGGALGGSDEGADDGMDMELEFGVLDQDQVEGAIRARWSSFQGCYRKAGEAQGYAEGRVALRFLVRPSGEVAQVLVTESDLGHFEVERCLTEVGKTLRLSRPRGRKEASFDYSITFRSTGERKITDVRWDEIAPGSETLLASLHGCGALGPRTVTVTLYIFPSGAVAAVGLASQEKLDESYAACLVNELGSWRLAGLGALPRSSVLRTRLTLSDTILAGVTVSQSSVVKPTTTRRRR